MTDTVEQTAPADGGAGQGQPQADAPWYQGQPDDIVGYLQNRGLDKLSPAEAAFKAIEAHRNAEKHLGAPADQIVRLPKGADDVEGYNNLFNKLGRPPEADGYELKSIPNVDDEFISVFGPMAHKAGLTKQQAQDLTRQFAEITAKQAGETSEAAQARQQVERQEVTKDWGANASANANTVQRAFEKLGFGEEEIGAIVNALGYQRTMNTFLEIGTRLGEDVYVQNQLPGGAGKYTRQGALDRIQQLKADTAWTSSYLNGDAEKRRELEDLHQIAYG